MKYFCTLFDSNYLSRGLVTYESLMYASRSDDQNTEGGAHLYVFAFDDLCFDILTQMRLPNLTVIALSDFEDEALLSIKPTRSRGEYCWTATSSTILYCIKTFDLPHCTYIDADMFFYNNPKVLLDELPSDANVLITEHRYTPQYDKSKLSGKYCVQFMYFDSSENGLKVLNWWREKCLEWCFNRMEDGKFGDQKYLDDWTERFDNVHVLKHAGGGLAPWNIQQFDFKTEENVIEGTVKSKYLISNIEENEGDLTENEAFKPIFFHFHGLKIYQNDAAVFAPKMYILSKTVRSVFYEPYAQKLLAAQKTLESYDSDFNKIGFQSAEQYSQDRLKGWGGFVKTNILNKYFGLKLN